MNYETRRYEERLHHEAEALCAIAEQVVHLVTIEGDPREFQALAAQAQTVLARIRGDE